MQVLAAFLKAIGCIIPLMDAMYASYYTKEVMVVLVREFQTPDEEMKKIVLKVGFPLLCCLFPPCFLPAMHWAFLVCFEPMCSFISLRQFCHISYLKCPCNLGGLKSAHCYILETVAVHFVLWWCVVVWRIGLWKGVDRSWAVALQVVQQCVATEGVEPNYVRAEILPEFFRSFWVRRMALDRRNYRALVETTVELANKVSYIV